VLIRRILSAFGKWVSHGSNGDKRLPSPTEAVSKARRSFFAKAAVGAVSVSGAAGLAKAVVDSMPEPELHDHYRKDSLAGEQELRERDYVLMSDREKEDMVQQFVDNYHGKT